MSHYVKCTICNQSFDRDKIEFVKTGARRYAHLSCKQRQDGTISEEDNARIKIYEYTKNLFKANYNKPRIDNQLNRMMKEQTNYTYSGILKSLIYWYEVRHGDVEKSHYGLGIIPYIYEQAYQYYYSIWLAQQNNENKKIEDYISSDVTVVKIVTPKRVPFIKERHFNILNEEGESNGF